MNDNAPSDVLSFAELAPVLAKNGFDPVPIVPGTKRPGVAGWQKGGFVEQAHKFPGHFTGILTGPCVGVDIDVSDKTLVHKLKILVMDAAGCHC